MRSHPQSLLHDRYLIERDLGHGGMDTVYLAPDTNLQRPVAVKVLPPDLAMREELRERFLRETRMPARGQYVTVGGFVTTSHLQWMTGESIHSRAERNDASRAAARCACSIGAHLHENRTQR